jgi:hypothetical protein
MQTLKILPTLSNEGKNESASIAMYRLNSEWVLVPGATKPLVALGSSIHIVHHLQCIKTQFKSLIVQLNLSKGME